MTSIQEGAQLPTYIYDSGEMKTEDGIQMTLRVDGKGAMELSTTNGTTKLDFGVTIPERVIKAIQSGILPNLQIAQYLNPNLRYVQGSMDPGVSVTLESPVSDINTVVTVNPNNEATRYTRVMPSFVRRVFGSKTRYVDSTNQELKIDNVSLDSVLKIASYGLMSNSVNIDTPEGDISRSVKSLLDSL